MNLIANPKLKPFFATFCAAGWSLAYPFIKLGYQLFSIDSSDLGSKLLFAGLRFTSAGLFVLLFAICLRKKLKIQDFDTVKFIIIFGLVGTTLQYLFTYIGLSYLPSSRSTIINSFSSFLLVVLSGLFFADDRVTKRKLLGCLVGLIGIILVTYNPGENLFADISFMGDGMIILNAVAAAFGGVLARIVSKKMDILSATAYSMTFGGLVLLLTALIIGTDAKWTVTIKGILTLFVLIMISAVCFSIYNSLLSFHPVSSIAIYNALIPVLGVIFSSIILHEPFKLQYLVAGIVVASGVYIVNTTGKSSR